MARKTVLVKVSGDLCHREDVLKWIKARTEGYFVVICVGGGTQINQAFIEHGLTVDEHGPLGRATETFQEKQIARDILEVNQAKVQDLLSDKRISASVVIPVLDIGTVLCHVNGDIFVLAAYHGYDRIYVATLQDRANKKRQEFARYPKIEVVVFPTQS